MKRIDGVDVEAGRLLTGMTRAQLGRRAAVSEKSVQRLELGDWVREATQYAITRALHLDGVRFERPGVVRHVDGRLAPTVDAIGTLDGVRIRKACYGLAWTAQRLASEAGLSEALSRRLLRGRRLNAVPSKPVWAAMSALQLAGCMFGVRNGAAGSSDRHPRRVSIQALKANSDLPISRLWGKPGLGNAVREG